MSKRASAGRKSATKGKPEGKAADSKNQELPKGSVDMMLYLYHKGAFKREPKGPDGLTDSQRKRRLIRAQLLNGPALPFCMIDRLRKPYNPCDPCAGSRCCDPRWIC